MKIYNNTGYCLIVIWSMAIILVACKTPSNQVTTTVVGVTYDGRQAVEAKLQVGETVRLSREPDNPYDPNAIRVDRQTGEQIGYINRQLATSLASSIDAYSKTIEVDPKTWTKKLHCLGGVQLRNR